MNNFLLNYFKILSKKNFDNPFIEIKALINNSRSVKNEIILSNFDESNINGHDKVITLPQNPDESAKQLQKKLLQHFVVINF